MYEKIAGKLKQYHHVRLDAEFKLDCLTWIYFLQDENASLSRPFVDFNGRTVTADEIQFFTDASKKKTVVWVGYSRIDGCFHNGKKVT